MSYNIKAPSERADKNGPVAQLGERTVRIRKVESSILFVSTITNQSEPYAGWRWVRIDCFFVIYYYFKAILIRLLYLGAGAENI